jgi:hypothetical protein
MNVAGPASRHHIAGPSGSIRDTRPSQQITLEVCIINIVYVKHINVDDLSNITMIENII